MDYEMKALSLELDRLRTIKMKEEMKREIAALSSELGEPAKGALESKLESAGIKVTDRRKVI